MVSENIVIIYWYIFVIKAKIQSVITSLTLRFKLDILAKVNIKNKNTLIERIGPITYLIIVIKITTFIICLTDILNNSFSKILMTMYGFGDFSGIQFQKFP